MPLTSKGLPTWSRFWMYFPEMLHLPTLACLILCCQIDALSTENEAGERTPTIPLQYLLVVISGKGQFSLKVVSNSNQSIDVIWYESLNWFIFANVEFELQDWPRNWLYSRQATAECRLCGRIWLTLAHTFVEVQRHRGRCIPLQRKLLLCERSKIAN